MIGPLQFWPLLRREYLPPHRIAGRIDCVMLLVSATAALGLARKIEGSPAYSLGRAGLARARLTTTGLAIVAIRHQTSRNTSSGWCAATW